MRGKKILLKGALGLILVLGVLSASGCSPQNQGNPKVEGNPTQRLDRPFDPRPPIVGRLSGVPVKIPFEFAELVEYDGESTNWGQRPFTPPPPRTQDSGISSFGFSVKYPEMVGPTTWRMVKERSNYMDEGSPWLGVGIGAGDIYPPSGYLDRVLKSTVEYKSRFNSESDKVYEYEKLPETQYGLTVYAPPGIDAKTGKPRRESKRAKELYVAFDEAGHVKTYITCDFNRLSPYCSQSISMEPEMKVDVDITYAQEDLKDWADIEQKVRALILSFVNASPEPRKVEKP